MDTFSVNEELLAFSTPQVTLEDGPGFCYLLWVVVRRICPRSAHHQPANARQCEKKKE